MKVVEEKAAIIVTGGILSLVCHFFSTETGLS
jgi:hypothetical protein